MSDDTTTDTDHATGGDATGGDGAASDHAGVRVERDGGVLRLTLARPARRNAIDDAMMATLIDEIDAAGRDESVRCIVLAGDGDHFCSGADIVARNAPTGERPRVGSIQRRLPSQANRLIPLVLTVQTPVVCSVQGWVAGIGLNLALAADVTLAADDARFWTPFVPRGFTPDSGATWLLPRRVGEVRARRMLLLGEVVEGATAEEWGLVHAVVPAAERAAATEEVVGRLAGGPTVALGLTKWLLHSSWSQGVEQHLRDEAFALELSSRSEDFKEGLRAFREKRDPDFGGR
jgi:2-(1,2-epoxy-1,2-dihydrophenyl)acetyl-CoA isomerase